jgi:hypothetical protein
MLRPTTGSGDLNDARRSRHAWYGSGAMIVACLAVANLALHLYAGHRYGYFRDELYYIACGKHLDWGYVDQPPMIALITRATRLFLGDSLVVLRLVPALATSGLILVTGSLARELSGGRFAQGLAALSVLIAPVYLAMGGLLTMNAFEPLIWMGCIYVVLAAIRRNQPSLLIWFGLLAGVGLETKYSMLAFGLGLAGALLLTPARRLFASPWMWAAGGVALLLLLPNLLWNIHRHFPFVELMHNIQASGRDIHPGPIEFVLQQVLLIGPLSLPVWVAGLWFCFFSGEGRYRLIGWTFAIVFLVFFVLHGKNYYLAPAYPMLFAAGGVALERAFSRPRLGWLKPAYSALLLVGGVAFLPLVVPVLPVEAFLKYQDAMPVKAPAAEKSHLGAALPQHFADQFGWSEMVAAVGGIYNGLSPDEQPRTAIFCSNYGEAAAIDFFGARYGLPEAISGHQNYFYWGPRGYTGEIVIVLGGNLKELTANFNSVERVADLNNPYAMTFENHPIYVCRGIKQNLQEMWPRLKNWD